MTFLFRAKKRRKLKEIEKENGEEEKKNGKENAEKERGKGSDERKSEKWNASEKEKGHVLDPGLGHVTDI